jgi:hypothetical protein
METIAKPRNEAELVLLKSLFEAEDIQYFVQNDNFGSILVGPQIAYYNEKAIMVPPEFADRAREIVADLRRQDVPVESKTGLLDRLRMIVETLVFSWFVPGRRRRKSDAATGSGRRE